MGYVPAISQLREIILSNPFSSTRTSPPQSGASPSQLFSFSNPPIFLSTPGIPALWRAFSPASMATKRNLEVLRFIEEKVQTTIYNPTTRVDVDRGQFEFDCSGMTNWILEQTAPVAYAELNAQRARVAEYVKTFKTIPYDQPSPGWRRLQKIADAEPGDIIAWPTPDWYPSEATGHMGIVVAKPEAVPGGYLVCIADATSYPHGEDSRQGGTGFGYGTVLITVDSQTGTGTGQGWTGRYSQNTVIRTPIYLGRPLK